MRCADNAGSAHLLVNVGIQVADKQVRPHVLLPLVLGSFVYANGLPIHFDHVQHLDRLHHDRILETAGPVLTRPLLL